MIRGSIWKQSLGLPRLLTSTIPKPNDFTHPSVSACWPSGGSRQAKMNGSFSFGTSSSTPTDTRVVVVALKPSVSVTVSAT